jgi:hypothetical protein
MIRSALVISTLAVVTGLGCGGRENGASASTGLSNGGSSGASALPRVDRSCYGEHCLGEFAPVSILRT